MSGSATDQVVRQRAAHPGHDPASLAKVGGHSLPTGFVYQGTRNGSATTLQTGHAGLDSVEVYRRKHAPLIGNAVTDIGLRQYHPAETSTPFTAQFTTDASSYCSRGVVWW